MLATSLITAAGVGLLSGTHAAIWGMYKDSIYEGFHTRAFVRSMIVGVFAAIGIQSVLRFDLSSPAAVVLLFGLAYAAERGIVETWKTFVRVEDQAKYFIPMAFSWKGVPVESPRIRLAAGAGYGISVGLLLLTIARLPHGTGVAQTVATSALAGLIVGLIIAIGGAWKDAPKEGFEPRKFFRSPSMTVAFGLLLSSISDSYVEIAVAAIGYERAAVESYKMLLTAGGKPPGKFFGKPELYPAMRRSRRYAVPVFLCVWLIVLGSSALASRSVVTGQEVSHGWQVERRHATRRVAGGSWRTRSAYTDETRAAGNHRKPPV